MPTSQDPVLFSLTARIAFPRRILWRKTISAAVNTTEMANVISRVAPTWTMPRWSDNPE